MNAIWNIAHTDDKRYAPLEGDREVDVVIIGGGVTGLTTALKLIDAGKRVAVLEAHRIGAGSTGRSTGNLYATVSQGLAPVRKKHGVDTIRAIVACRNQAIDFIEQTIKRFAIECEFSRRPLYHCVHHANDERSQGLDAELDASIAAGLSASLVDNDVPLLPFAPHRAFRLDNQAQYNPLSYVRGLAKVISERNGLIFEDSEVMNVDAADGKVVTRSGTVRAHDIVFATHTPKGVSLLQAQMQPYQEYGISAELKPGAAYPDGAFWIVDDAKSIRSYEYNGKHYLVVIGGKHKTGHGDLGAGYYSMLEGYAKAHFDVARFEHRWSAQQYQAADQLPYIGRSGKNNLFVGTGYAADGLTWSAVAADVIASQIMGQGNADIGELFNPRRFTPIKSGKSWIQENTTVAKHLFKAQFGSTESQKVDQIKAGEGGVVTVDGDKLAVYRAANNELTVMSAECPHMKCLVNWNGADSTWECPCHGSKFAAKGELIEGPAYEGLAPHPMDLEGGRTT